MKCQHTFYVGMIGAMDGEGPGRCTKDAVTQGYCADHGGARTGVMTGVVCGEPDSEESTSRETFTLAELFSDEELQHPEKCQLTLMARLVTENTAGRNVARADLVVTQRPPMGPKPKAPYR